MLWLIFPSTVLLLSLLVLKGRPGAPPAKSAQPPPHRSSWIPWMGCAIAVRMDFDKFLLETSRKIGAVFSAHVAGKHTVFITSPEIIQYVYRNPSKFVFSPIRREVQMNVFGQSKTIDNEDMETYLYPMHKRLLSSNAFPQLVSKFVEYTLRDIDLRCETLGPEGIIVDAKDLAHEMVFSSSSRAFFGPRFPLRECLPSFTTFDDNFAVLTAELPSFMVTSAVSAREKTLDILESFYQDMLDLEASGEEPFEEMCEVARGVIDHARTREWPRRDVASHILADCWALLANAPLAAVWTVIKLAEHPEALKQVRAEIEAGMQEALALRPDSGLSPIENLVRTTSVYNGPNFPLLASSIQETLRICTINGSMRQVAEDTVLPFATPRSSAGAQLDKGQIVLCVGRAAHMNDELYENPGEWIPERFMHEYRMRMKEKGMPDPLVGYLPWGGGVSMCEGRAFANQELRIFVITFFHFFDLEKIGTKPVDWDSSRVMGVVPLKGDARFKLRKRVHA